MRELESTALGTLIEVSSDNVAVSFSGGKDSLVALDLSVRVGIKKVVFVNTTIEFDETLEYIDLVKDFYDIELEIVSAPVDFFDMISRVGIPSRRFRWCCDVFKFGPLAKYALRHNIDGFITGLRKDESHRRFGYTTMDINPLVPVKQINPIIEWSDNDVWNYIKTYNLPFNPLYNHFSRIGCWCCPYRTARDWSKIEELFPEKVKKFKRALYSYAEKVNIKDKKQFVEKRGWTAWTIPLRKIYVGGYTIDGSEGKEVEIVFGNGKEQIDKVIKLLPILTDAYHISGNRLHIQINGFNIKKLNTLIEKALNCVGCGACTALCKYNALYIKDSILNIDSSKCIHCGKCLTTNILRGGCIMRNYSERRAALLRNTC